MKGASRTRQLHNHVGGYICIYDDSQRNIVSTYYIGLTAHEYQVRVHPRITILQDVCTAEKKIDAKQKNVTWPIKILT